MCVVPETALAGVCVSLSLLCVSVCGLWLNPPEAVLLAINQDQGLHLTRQLEGASKMVTPYDLQFKS